MGVFSWLYADTGNQMRCGAVKDSYLLVPPEWQQAYGMYLYTFCYDGYGHVGPYDVYELLAVWNMEYLSDSMLEKPARKDYRSIQNYSRAKCVYKVHAQMVSDFKEHVSDVQMREIYGPEYLREIGILIGCYDWQQEKLRYPLKFVETYSSEYRDDGYYALPFSKRDPKQGCM